MNQPDTQSDIRGALQNLVDRLELIHADPAFQSVWTISHFHIGPYSGPTYVDELNEAKRALSVLRADGNTP